MTWTVKWHSGDVDSASTASDLLLQLSYVQKASAARDNIRAALAWRCHVIFSEVPDIHSTDDEFLRECAGLGLFDLQVT